ncbi:MAG TPA: methionine--tRNA ligase [Rubricoccaceae bacterium]|nr:methionine--tRNA ligase [Rubricoccaceae bacterium]
MPDARRPLLVTSALPYANGPLHLGHLAGAYLPADLYVRYQRLTGRDVVYVCGSDEHGVPILLRAREEGVSPQEIVDRYHVQLRDAFAVFGISFDVYGRTSAPAHHATSQAFFLTLERAGLFRKKTERQLYDPEAGLFLADRFVRGTCPICGYPDAYGDQCENCGTSLSPRDLKEPRSALSGAAPVEKETTHWYFPLGTWQPKLESWIAEQKNWKPNVLGQIRSWFNDGLSDRAMTRDLPWGVPVPGEVEGDVEGKALYVWFDAPIGYLSATKKWAEATGDPERWRRYWTVHPDGAVPELLHFIGKDNIVFHAIIFPALLMAHNEAAGPAEPEFVLPANVPANEFLNLEGQKLSTSRGWAVWAHEAAEAFPVDTLRYALAATLPETKDNDFAWADFQTRVNNDLADVLGNFVHRTLTFAHRFFGGVVPEAGPLSDASREVLALLETATAQVGEAYEGFRFRDAVFRTIDVARTGNKYLNDAAPWHAIKADRAAAASIVHVSLQVCASLAILLEPVVPYAAERLRRMLRLEGVRPSTPGGEGQIGWADAARSLLDEGHALGAPEILFSKIEDEAVEAQRQLLERRAAEASGEATPAEPAEPGPPYAEPKQQILYDDFARLDLRVGKVIAAEPHPNADKLLRLDVDLGYETRQVLAGIRAHFTPEEMVGRHVVVVANLAPRQIRGLESRGMLLFAEDRDGRLRAVTTDGEPGGVVK